jgi:hypothetical protein
MKIPADYAFGFELSAFIRGSVHFGFIGVHWRLETKP